MSSLGKKETICKVDEIRYLEELRGIQANKSNWETRGLELWWEDIKEGVDDVLSAVREVESLVGVLRGINSAVEAGDLTGVWSYLTNNIELLGLGSRPRLELGKEYMSSLESVWRSRQRVESRHTWVETELGDGSKVWLEVEGGSHSWMEPNTRGAPVILGLVDIRLAIDNVSGQNSPELISNLVQFQSRCRGSLVRSRIFSMLDWYYRHEKEIVLTQALWRGKRARRLFKDLVRQVRQKREEIRECQNLEYLKRYEKQVVQIQRFWRATRRRRAKQQLVGELSSGLPSLESVVKHIHLLDVKDSDFREELDVQTVRGKLSKLIRGNEQLEKRLDEMDVKIGLLVQNRISVQEVVGDGKKGGLITGTLRRGGERLDGPDKDVRTHRGLKALKKESHDKLLAYQHLFYLLQTDPNYLARMIFAMPQSKTTKFLENVILTLYNFGGNSREEYLLLQLFKTALVEEIMTRMDKLQDVAMGNPLVIKLVVSYNRSGRGGYALKELVGPLVKQVLEDNKLKINTNPVEVYKTWINQIESETGQPAGLPYDVSQEVALNYEEVQNRLDKSIKELKRMTTLFLATIITGIGKFPYGILYMAKVLFRALQQKFPEVQEKELLKVVGNLIYYRYVNPTIVAPERFDIVDKKVDQVNLNNDQRRNLGSIAKILQFAASKKGFGEESEHLMVLNPFIIECHEKFKTFFHQCCSVTEPEVQFNIDQYTEAVLIAKPCIYISLSELCDTHQLLLDYKESVTPNPKDQMHQLLDSLGTPSLCSLLGAADDNSFGSLSSLGKTEVCLTLSPASGSISSPTTSDTDKLWLKTKHLLLAILPAAYMSPHTSLIGCLKSRTTHEQEEDYCHLLDRRELATGQAGEYEGLDLTNVFCDEEGRLPLEDSKRLVLKNLRILEVAGCTSSKDGCQTIISDLAKDILNQRDHRMRRKEELNQAARVKIRLVTKQEYMMAQLEQYRQYTTHCLASLNRAGSNKRVHFTTSHTNGTQEKRVRSRAAIKYAATKLHEKGVLQNIDGLPNAQLKNVQFVFLPLEQDGMFEVSARFMGVDMERVVLDIQELLQLQYEGQAVLNMFGKAKINVNLLLHFLNAKFYGK